MRLCFATAILLLLFASSCKKTADVIVAYNSLYYKNKLTAAGNMRLFANSGEIKDEQRVNAFLALDSSYYTYLKNNQVLMQGFLDTIQFKGPANATISNYSTQTNYTVSSDRGTMFLTAAEPSAGSTYGETFTRSFAYYGRQNKPDVANEYIISSARGTYQFGYQYTEKHVFIQAANAKIGAPVVMYVQHSPGLTGASGVFNDRLQQNFYTHIPKGDTLTLAEYELFYNN